MDGYRDGEEIIYRLCSVDSAYHNRTGAPEMKLVALEWEDPLPLAGKPRSITITHNLPLNFLDFKDLKEVRVKFTRPLNSGPNVWYRYQSAAWPDL